MLVLNRVGLPRRSVANFVYVFYYNLQSRQTGGPRAAIEVLSITMALARTYTTFVGVHKDHPVECQ